MERYWTHLNRPTSSEPCYSTTVGSYSRTLWAQRRPLPPQSSPAPKEFFIQKDTLAERKGGRRQEPTNLPQTCHRLLWSGHWSLDQPWHIQDWCPVLRKPRIAGHHSIWWELLTAISINSKEYFINHLSTLRGRPWNCGSFLWLSSSYKSKSLLESD